VHRHLKPEATVKEMLIINRMLVILLIAISAFVALNVKSIMEAVIIATVIGTTSYFFPIIGGLYWKRATQWGALAGLVAGGGTQVTLISYELFWLRQPLDTLSPLLTEHGVLVGLVLSALFFVVVSLATPPTERIRLAPFFPEVAEELFGRETLAVRKGSRYPEILEMLEENVAGDRAHLNLYLDLRPTTTDSADTLGEMRWIDFVERLKATNALWFTPSGGDIVYRLSQADMLACIKMARGDAHQIWLSAEPRREMRERQRDEFYLAFEEIEGALLNFGLAPSLSKI
jgi:SSS family solute:Na+ symporter